MALDAVEDNEVLALQSLADESREEIEAMLMAGIESSPATPMSSKDWKQLHARIDQQNS